MNLIELHILQSFPVTCLNRDDLGSPKSAMFGGVERARVSSQCWKRAIRTVAHEHAPELFAGIRTKFIGPLLEKAAQRIACSEEQSQAYSNIIVNILGQDKAAGKVKTLLFLSPKTMDHVVSNLHESKQITENMVKAILADDKKTAEKGLAEACKAAGKILKNLGTAVSDAADIALFGRMVADDASQTIEGAAMFSHALSTHAVRSDLDFFSAVDDEKIDTEDAGGSHIGNIEFNSACYYRYIGINLDLLKQSKMFDQVQLQEVLKNFIHAVVMANPVARRNSMFGYSVPACILAVKRAGQPLSLANAFEEPVKASKNGYIAPSIAKMLATWDDMKRIFGLKSDSEVTVSKDGKSLDTMVEKMTDMLN